MTAPRSHISASLISSHSWLTAPGAGGHGRPALCVCSTGTLPGGAPAYAAACPTTGALHTAPLRHSLVAWWWLLGWRLAVGPAPLLGPAAGAAAAAPGRPAACRSTARRPNEATQACRGGSSSMPRRAYPTDGVMK